MLLSNENSFYLKTQCPFVGLPSRCRGDLVASLVCEGHLDLLFGIRIKHERIIRSDGSKSDLVYPTSSGVVGPTGRAVTIFPWLLNKSGVPCLHDLQYLEPYLLQRGVRRNDIIPTISAMITFFGDGALTPQTLGVRIGLDCEAANVMANYVNSNHAKRLDVENKFISCINSNATEQATLKLSDFPISAAWLISLFEFSYIKDSIDDKKNSQTPNVMVNLSTGFIEALTELSLYTEESTLADPLIIRGIRYWPNVDTYERFKNNLTKSSTIFSRGMTCIDPV